MIDMAKIQMTMARKTKERAIQSPGITIIGEGLTERFYFYLLPLFGVVSYYLYWWRMIKPLYIITPNIGS